MVREGETHRLGLGLGVDQGLAKVVVLGPVVARRVDDNLLVVVRQLVDDVLVLLAELEVVVRRYALGGDGGSGWGRVSAMRSFVRAPLAFEAPSSRMCPSSSPLSQVLIAAGWGFPDRWSPRGQRLARHRGQPSCGPGRRRRGEGED